MHDAPTADRLADLQRQLAERDEQIQLLDAELAETNLGVVALYAELDERAAQLREAAELKGRFLSYMSHEFRTPLGSIRSMAQLLLGGMDGALNEEQTKQVAFVKSAAEELSEMVDDLLDLAKVEAGRVSISPGWFDMVDLFSTLRGMFKPILTSHQVALIFEEPPAAEPLFNDDKKLAQILRNFISNALKFTPQGEVRVSAHCPDDRHIEFAVSDTGIGIAPEHLPTLFQDFVQVDSPLQKRFRGIGLGLSLSKHFAELLGGRVEASSTPGVGSTFRVRVPLRYEPLAPASGDAHER